MEHIGQCLEQQIATRTADGRAKAARAMADTGSERRVPPLLASEPSANDWRYCITTQCNWHDCVIGTGLYAPQLRGWLAPFPPEQLLLLEASQLLSEPLQVANLVQTFLSVPSLSAAAVGMAEAGQAADHGKEALADLQAFYAPHNRNVRRMFDALAPAGAWQRAPWLQAPAVSA
jgi:hypothetical protein